MTRSIIIEGNSVYEVDENCMLKKRRKSEKDKERSENTESDITQKDRK